MFQVNVQGEHGSPMHRRARTFLATVIVSILMAEAVVYLLLSFSYCVVTTTEDYRCRNNFGLISKSMAQFDLETGYRWVPGRCRIVRVAGGEVAYENTFRINNAGYHSERDYEVTKKEGVYRIAVLGDSFTNELHQRPWPDTLHELLPSLFEIYAFGVDGGGVVNWHRVFFGEIVPHYEFDALVVASFLDNLRRQYTVFHATSEALYFGRFPAPPASEHDFHHRYLPRMTRTASVLGDEEIDHLVKRIRVKTHSYLPLRVDVYGTKHVYRRVRATIRGWSERSSQADARIRPTHIPPPHLDMLKEIVEYCQSRKKPVILSPIPERKTLERRLADGQSPPHAREIRQLAERLETLYFDGYDAFEGIDPEEISRLYWLRLDAHWGQKASDLYARKLSRFVLESRDLNPQP